MENRARQISIFIVIAALAFGSAWAFTRGQPTLNDGLSGKSVVSPQLISKLHSGDLIFRRGRDAVSGMVLKLDGRLPFSHVGIVEVEGNWVWVIHAVPAEGNEKKGSVKREPLEVFADSERADSVGVFRVPNFPEHSASRVIAVAKNYLGRPFDTVFDLENDKQIYCTELAWLAYRGAGIDMVGRLEYMKLPLHQGPVILPRSMVEGGKLERIL